MVQPNIANAKILPPRKRGRPKAGDVIALTNHIVLVARDVFFELGFGAATIDMVAARARISKETLYSRFKDKQVLFEAVMQALIDSWTEGTSNYPVINAETLEEELYQTAMIQIRAMLHPDFQNMSRLIDAEINTFPGLSKLFLEKVSSDRIGGIIGRIEKFAKIDGIPCRDAETAAEAFRGTITGWVQILIKMEPEFSPKKQEEVARRIVEIFMASRAVW